MKPSERRKQMREELAKRTQESYDTKDNNGKYKSFLMQSMMGKVQKWKCSEDEHFIDIIPFYAGPKHPTKKAGSLVYSVDVFVHRKVGVNEDEYICLAKTYDKKCPICEHAIETKKLEEYDKEYVKSLNPTRRVVYNIVCRDTTKEEEKGIQIFDVSHWLFENKIVELARMPRGGGYVPFSDPDVGKMIFFRKSGKGQTNTEYKGFQFHDRETAITDEILDSALTLDELLYIPTYDEVKNAFFGGDETEEFDEQDRTEQRHEAEISERDGEIEPVFTCPGNYGEDYGNFDGVCENCPDVESCEKEYEKIEQALKEEEAAAKKKEEEEAAAAKKKEEEKPESISPSERRRRLRDEPTATETQTAKEPETAKEPTTESAPSGRRVRRRPE